MSKDERTEQEQQRFNDRNIRVSEQMYGEGWQSPGGIEIVKDFASRINPAPGKNMLDMGSGLGGALFYFAKEHGMTGFGVDFAEAMVRLSTKRAVDKKLSDKVKFAQGDLVKVNLEPEHFDLVWSRDAILYIALEDKAPLWSSANLALKSGGELLVTDFLRGDGERSPKFETYLKKCGYHLQTFDDYESVLRCAGFVEIKRENITSAFIKYLKEDRVRLAAKEEAFVTEFSQQEYDHLMTRWQGKIDMCKDGDLQWGVFTAKKY